MAVRVELYYDGIGDVMRMNQVRAALHTHASGIAGRARGLSEGERVTSSIATESGTRPKGRSYARVVSDAVHAEFGSAKTPRRRLLARAAGL